MGSKNLKAIAVKGNEGVKIAHPEKFIKAITKCNEMLKPMSFGMGFKGGNSAGNYGSIWYQHQYNSKLGTKHHQAASWEDADKLDPSIFHSQYRIKMLGCFSCPVQCMPRFRIKEGPHAGLYREGPEFESFASFGSMVLSPDLDSVLKSAELTNKYGLDCDSTGRVISFAMELFERKIITEDEIGFPLKWGDKEAILRMIELKAKREGFGDILAEGELRAAKKIGRGAENYALTIKGLEFHESFRGSGAGHALGHSTSTRGSDHLRSSHHAEHSGLSPEDAEKFYGYKEAADRTIYKHKEKQVIYNEYNTAIADILEVCKLFSHWTTPFCIGQIYLLKSFRRQQG